MNYSRRDFIRIGGLSALTVVSTAGASRAFGQNVKGSDFLSQMRFVDFSSRIGTRFYMTFGETGEVVETVLTEVRDLSPAKAIDRKRRGENFSLVFTVSDNTGAKQQATYEVIHREMGNFPLFLVPGSSGNGESLLIATFYRL